MQDQTNYLIERVFTLLSLKPENDAIKMRCGHLLDLLFVLLGKENMPPVFIGRELKFSSEIDLCEGCPENVGNAFREQLCLYCKTHDDPEFPFLPEDTSDEEFIDLLSTHLSGVPEKTIVVLRAKELNRLAGIIMKKEKWRSA